MVYKVKIHKIDDNVTVSGISMIETVAEVTMVIVKRQREEVDYVCNIIKAYWMVKHKVQR